ncbi:putative U box domain, Zinc finger, RING/FYVE/PHD-type [Helianthus annuus]|nr:putative U box domain, Zinc finger, RING/FYVE/PHD-type [Helianthus annuus]
MIEELDEPEVPSMFICLISLEPMQDPVMLCTRQTYERSNILKWFNLGHFTCPTTMQELWDDSVTPNKTLHQLIHTWFAQKYLQMKKKIPRCNRKRFRGVRQNESYGRFARCHPRSTRRSLWMSVLRRNCFLLFKVVVILC